MLRIILLMVLSLFVFGCNNKKSYQEELKEVKEIQEQFGNNCDGSISKLTELAEKGNSCAQFNLGIAYLKYDIEIPCVKKDNKIALKWLEAAANQNNGDALTKLGLLYEGKYGFEEDLKKAVHYYQLGAKVNSAFSNYNLASLYLEGKGVPKDVSKAFSHFKAASDLGDHEASLAIGKMYLNSVGVEANYKTALKYFKMASDGGNKEAEPLYMSALYRSLSEDFFNKSCTSEEYIKMGDQFVVLAKYALRNRAYEGAEDCAIKAKKSYYYSCDDTKDAGYEGCRKFIQMQHGSDLQKFGDYVDGLNRNSFSE